MEYKKLNNYDQGDDYLLIKECAKYIQRVILDYVLSYNSNIKKSHNIKFFSNKNKQINIHHLKNKVALHKQKKKNRKNIKNISNKSTPKKINNINNMNNIVNILIASIRIRDIDVQEYFNHLVKQIAKMNTPASINIMIKKLVLQKINQLIDEYELDIEIDLFAYENYSEKKNQSKSHSL